MKKLVKESLNEGIDIENESANSDAKSIISEISSITKNYHASVIKYHTNTFRPGSYVLTVEIALKNY